MRLEEYQGILKGFKNMRQIKAKRIVINKDQHL